MQLVACLTQEPEVPSLIPASIASIKARNIILNHLCDCNYKITMSNIHTGHLRQHL